MKKQFHHGNQKGKSFQKHKKFPYELTIGMIVKNDAERLRTCLESMQGLRDAISCQLIITDTGSTDGTREVAEEFADILLDFQWCDDFSKARNTGVEKAQGRWFTFIDSDFEFDESFVAIVDFLKSKESYEADCGFANIRNYTGTMENLSYMDNRKPLFLNFGEKRRYFEGRIHEGIVAYIDTAVNIPVTIQHWGYMGDLTEQKNNRNIPLLLAGMEDDPLEMKNYIQITAELSEKPLERKEYVLKGIEAAKKNIALGRVEQLEEAILVNLQLQLAKVGVQLKDDTLIAQGLAEAEGKFTGSILELEYLGLKLTGLLRNHEGAEVLRCFLKLQALYLKLQKNPDIYYINTGHFNATDSNYYHIQEYYTLVYALNHEEKDLFRPVLEGAFAYEYENLQGEHTYLRRYLELAKQLKSPEFLYKIYDFIQKNGSKNAKEKQEVEHMLGTCFLQYKKKDYQNLLHGFSEASPNDLLVPYLCEAGTEDFASLPRHLIPYFQESSQLYTLHYKVLLLHYLKTGQDSFGYIKTAKFSLLVEQFDQYWKQYPQPQHLIYEMFARPMERPTWKEKKLCGTIGLRALHSLCQGEGVEKEQMKALYQGASVVLGEFVGGVYQPLMLDSEEKDLIPKVEMFAYHSHKAWLSQEQGDTLGFVKSLKLALVAHQDYQKIVTFFIALLQEKNQPVVTVEPEQSRSQPVVQGECPAMNIKVKKTIGSLILSGDTQKAKRILEKYKNINPTDPDLAVLERSL